MSLTAVYWMGERNWSILSTSDIKVGEKRPGALAYAQYKHKLLEVRILKMSDKVDDLKNLKVTTDGHLTEYGAIGNALREDAPSKKVVTRGKGKKQETKQGRPVRGNVRNGKTDDTSKRMNDPPKRTVRSKGITQGSQQLKQKPSDSDIFKTDSSDDDASTPGNKSKKPVYEITSKESKDSSSDVAEVLFRERTPEKTETAVQNSSSTLDVSETAVHDVDSPSKTRVPKNVDAQDVPPAHVPKTAAVQEASSTCAAPKTVAQLPEHLTFPKAPPGAIQFLEDVVKWLQSREDDPQQKSFMTSKSPLPEVDDKVELLPGFPSVLISRRKRNAITKRRKHQPSLLVRELLAELVPMEQLKFMRAKGDKDNEGIPLDVLTALTNYVAVYAAEPLSQAKMTKTINNYTYALRQNESKVTSTSPWKVSALGLGDQQTDSASHRKHKPSAPNEAPFKETPPGVRCLDFEPSKVDLQQEQSTHWNKPSSVSHAVQHLSNHGAQQSLASHKPGHNYYPTGIHGPEMGHQSSNILYNYSTDGVNNRYEHPYMQQQYSNQYMCEPKHPQQVDAGRDETGFVISNSLQVL